MTMAEVHEHVGVQRASSRKRGLRRSNRLNLIVAGFSWGIAAVVLAFSLWHWLHASIQLVDLINVAFGVIGATLGGILALSGDGDVVLLTGADERQRRDISAASTIAFNLTFWGLFGLWMAYQLVPSWRADAYIHVGILLFAAMILYLMSYLWRRGRV
jgi:hypothetical protein